MEVIPNLWLFFFPINKALLSAKRFPGSFNKNMHHIQNVVIPWIYTCRKWFSACSCCFFFLFPNIFFMSTTKVCTDVLKNSLQRLNLYTSSYYILCIFRSHLAWHDTCPYLVLILSHPPEKAGQTHTVHWKLPWAAPGAYELFHMV